MNQNIFEHLAERFRSQTGIELKTDRKARARLLEAAEIAKIELSTNITTHISLPYIAAVGGEPRHLELDLTRAELERLVRPVIERCRGPIDQAIRDAGIGARDISRLVFVGGPTRMPVVRSYFEEIFGKPGEAGVDPMECVACGAAIQAGVLAGEVGDILLVDVTPLTLGVETLGGIATPLIARNTPVPAKRSEIFTTAADMQTAVTIHVFQGERPMAADNTSLGEFNLSGLPPAPRGIPKIDVTFDIDASGILNVTAKDMATAKSQSIRISGSTRLPDADKKRMVEEAERYAEADKKRREEAEKLNAADSVAYQAEKLLADYGEKLSADQKTKIESALRETREAVSKRDSGLAVERSEALKRILQEAGATLYAESAQAGREPQPSAAQARPTGSGPHGRVVDAEYKEV
jgi:molecular chaperone DnaK